MKEKKMQVKSIAVPVEAQLSSFGGDTFFVADSAQVACVTLGGERDFVADGVVDVPASVWVAVPFGRDVLVSAAMISELCLAELNGMSDDELREWVIGALMHEGLGAVQREIRTADFRSGYRTYPDGGVAAEFITAVGARLDVAFGFSAAAQATTAPAHRCEASPARVLLPA